ncbi:MAG TPA: hypothetical protein VIM98_00100 [Dyella sp.]|uniref:hypothetical protein n=1 Tax=Dyella sp. TaxID=1869338 RepID=UPI002F95FC1F
MDHWQPLPSLAGPLYGKEPWPLRFHTHDFDAACYNTLACSIIYNRHQFGTRQLGYDGQYYDRPSGPPPSEHWKDDWDGSHIILTGTGETFPGPVEIEWTAMDGSQHQVSLNLDGLFRDRLVLHKVQRNEIREAWLATCSVDPVSPDILVEVNDRTVSVYMRATVVTEAEQIPGNPNSHIRDDLMLAWTLTY